MATYALVQNNQIQRQQVFTETPPILSENKGVWLLIVDELPSYDPETQRLETGDFVINPDNVTRQYTIHDLTPQELAFKPYLASPEVSVGRDQFIIALHRKGLLAAIESALDANPNLIEFKLFYQNRPTFNSHNPLVISMAIDQGLTPAQVADVFAEAQTVLAT